MTHKCAWCSSVLPYKDKPAIDLDGSDVVSHGICEKCYLMEMQKNGLISKAEKIRLRELEKKEGNKSYGI